VNVTIQGYQFDVPPAGLVVGDPKTENEVHVLEQVRIENIRNNFAPKIKKLLNGSETLTEEQLATARQEVAAYANEYKFGQRKAGGGALDNLFNAKRDEYVKRARRNLADRQRAGEEVLAAAGV
jgi:hypothetical protein